MNCARVLHIEDGLMIAPFCRHSRKWRRLAGKRGGKACSPEIPWKHGRFRSPKMGRIPIRCAAASGKRKKLCCVYGAIQQCKRNYQREKWQLSLLRHGWQRYNYHRDCRAERLVALGGVDRSTRPDFGALHMAQKAPCCREQKNAPFPETMTFLRSQPPHRHRGTPLLIRCVRTMRGEEGTT